MQTLKTAYNTNGKIKYDEITREDISQALIEEITNALKSVKGYGSIEIYVQDFSVTQITIRNIKKTKHILAE